MMRMEERGWGEEREGWREGRGKGRGREKKREE